MTPHKLKRSRWIPNPPPEKKNIQTPKFELGTGPSTHRTPGSPKVQSRQKSRKTFPLPPIKKNGYKPPKKKPYEPVKLDGIKKNASASVRNCIEKNCADAGLRWELSHLYIQHIYCFKHPPSKFLGRLTGRGRYGGGGKAAGWLSAGGSAGPPRRGRSVLRRAVCFRLCFEPGKKKYTDRCHVDGGTKRVKGSVSHQTHFGGRANRLKQY